MKNETTFNDLLKAAITQNTTTSNVLSDIETLLRLKGIARHQKNLESLEYQEQMLAYIDSLKKGNLK